jgi:hypothetical protein
VVKGKGGKGARPGCNPNEPTAGKPQDGLAEEPAHGQVGRPTTVTTPFKPHEKPKG